MSEPKVEDLGINSWLEDELYQQYLNDKRSVDDSWQSAFAGTAAAAAPAAPAAPIPVPAPVTAPVAVDVAPPAAPAPKAVAAAPKAVAPAAAVSTGNAEQLVPLRGVAGKIAENMNLSLSVPTATSQRAVPVKVIDENRVIINEHRAMLGQSKISYTHLIAWALVKALKAQPGINHAYSENAQGEAFRVVRNQINLGIAVDVAGKDGNRSLMVPCIKNAGEMDFFEFMASFDGLVARARAGKLTPGAF
ncbi:MAG: 2-oxo acid dehydrogenase subunit E2, partial [Bryobacteraceae bacterium]|nr:2-oxo acid dehydrogenase subunit E2 [Bryobacteraceae bacterium]